MNDEPASAPGEPARPLEVSPFDAETQQIDVPWQTAIAQPGDMWGPFRLLEKVGQGSFGEVYRAFDTKLEREVAVKLLLRGFGPAQNDANAVLKEARSLARVRHPNIVPVYGVDSFDGRVGFWSDFVHGKTLSSLLEVQGRFSAMEAALIGIDVCKAVGAVHAAGLLHRDIKTGNVMREDGGRILLMDFGLSAGNAEMHSLAGTPPYMAPELFAGERASVATDIYALGVLLFQLLTGKYPLEGRDLAQMMAARDTGHRRSLHDERSDLPDALVQAVETALATDPKARFATAGQMITALSGALGRGPVSMTQQFADPVPTARRQPFWIWPAGIAAIAAAVWFTPLRPALLHRSSPPAITSSAHADYLKAQDLLDHYYQLHKTEAAIDMFRRTIDQDPQFALAWAGLCRAYFIQLRSLEDPALTAQAQDACSKALALDHDLASAHVTLGMLYTLTTRNDLAEQELHQAASLDDKNPEVWAALADLYNKQGRIAKVVPGYQKAAELGPSDWRWPNQLGAYYLANGKFEEAASAFQQALKLTSDNALLWNNLGIAYRRQSKLKEAEQAFQKAIDIEPRDYFFSNLGLVLEEQGNYRRAADLYTQAISLNRSNYRAWASLAVVDSRLPGRSREAREMYLKAISLAEDLRKNNPRDASLLAQLGSFYAWIGKPDQSVPLLREAAALAPDDPQVLYHAAEGYEMMHRREEALHWIGLALDHKYSMDALRRTPEMHGLISDPRFATIGAHESTHPAK